MFMFRYSLRLWYSNIYSARGIVLFLCSGCEEYGRVGPVDQKNHRVKGACPGSIKLIRKKQCKIHASHEFPRRLHWILRKKDSVWIFGIKKTKIAPSSERHIFSKWRRFWRSKEGSNAITRSFRSPFRNVKNDVILKRIRRSLFRKTSWIITTFMHLWWRRLRRGPEHARVEFWKLFSHFCKNI